MKFITACWLLTGCLVPFALLGGCSQKASDQVFERLLPNPRSYVQDVPIPKGFHLVETAAEDRYTGSHRLYLRHVYEGAAHPYTVRKFYEEQMPLNRWQMTTNSDVKGEYSLRFEKGQESCFVQIQPEKRGWITRTQVHVEIAQEQRGTKASSVRE